jgi:hypothetical protein
MLSMMYTDKTKIQNAQYHHFLLMGGGGGFGIQMTTKVVYITMLTGPRIDAGAVTSSGGLFLTCRGEKYVQFCTIIYSEQYLRVGFFKKAKIPYLGVVAISASCEPHSTLDQCF